MIKRNQWYKLNEKEFTDILRFVNQDIANNQKYIESLNRIGDAFTNNKVLYLKLSRESIRQPLSWHYRTSYSEFYCGQCLEYKDIMFEEVNNSKTDKRTFITEDWSGTKYEIKLYTWYEVNLREYSSIVNGLPAEIRRDVFDDEVEYGLKAAKNNNQIYIMFDYYREIDDEHCRLSVSKNAPKEYAKPIKLMKLPANYELKVIDDMIAGDDKQTPEQIRKRAKKLILNSVYGTSFSDAMWCADWNTNVTKKVIENKEEKVMEENKIEAIRNIINKYEGDADRELNRQYDEQEKEVKAKDPNIIALREYIEVLNKNRAENTEPYNANHFNEIYTAETATQLDKLYNALMGKKRALREQCDEVRNLCILCDTYEQMRQILADYEIIPNNKKRGK